MVKMERTELRVPLGGPREVSLAPLVHEVYRDQQVRREGQDLLVRGVRLGRLDVPGMPAQQETLAAMGDLVPRDLQVRLDKEDHPAPAGGQGLKVCEV